MAIDKQHILDELRRIATVNGGRPPGQNEFKNETGISKYDWVPHYWVRWGDAQEEAGFSRNRFQEAFGKDLLIEKLISLIRRTKSGDKIRFPVEGEMLVEKKRTPDFPHANAFRQKFGRKSQMAAAILEHCRARSGFEDVIAACEEVVKTDTSPAAKEKESRDQGIVGSVYLKSLDVTTRLGGRMRLGEDNMS